MKAMFFNMWSAGSQTLPARWHQPSRAQWWQSGVLAPLLFQPSDSQIAYAMTVSFCPFFLSGSLRGEESPWVTYIYFTYIPPFPPSNNVHSIFWKTKGEKEERGWGKLRGQRESHNSCRWVGDGLIGGHIWRCYQRNYFIAVVFFSRNCSPS